MQFKFNTSPLLSMTADNAAVVSLEGRLADFYNTFNDYPCFSGVSKQSSWSDFVIQEIRKRHQGHDKKVRVLEIGAGSGSPFDGCGIPRSDIHYTAQEITNLTESSLSKVADSVHIGPLDTLDGEFDVIFSFFVLEHVVDPASFLSRVDALLVPGGVHVVVCPRYDFPGFVCPSMRHLSKGKLFKLETLRFVNHLLARVFQSKADFLINTEPAVFSRKWARDADAIHIVSSLSVVQWHSERGYQKAKLLARAGGFRDWLVKRCMTLAIAFTKPQTAAAKKAAGAFAG